MTSPILLTGGTGTLGSHVTPLLRAAGRDVRILSRRDRESAGGAEDADDAGAITYVTGDLLKDEGIEAAVDGVEIVLHLAGGPKGDEEATRNLVRAATRAGVKHMVIISVIGADRVPIGYFSAKLGAERVVAESGLPWSALRAAQFHELVLTVAGALAKLPVVPTPNVRLQPVDSRDVAARLVELTLGEPAGLVPDLAGPRVYPLGDLVRGYLRAEGKHRVLVPVRLPGKVGRVYRADGNLTLDGALLGERTWEDFLAERNAKRRP